MNIQELKLFIENANQNDDATFRKVIDESMRLLNLSEKELSGEFSCSLPTVGRWRNGVASPHPAMRPAVFKYLLDRIEDQQ